jgi:hypothetical protein
LGLLAATLLGLLARPAAAQEKPPDPQAVTILTPDYVELKGVFYPSAKGEKAPAVLLLHALNEDSKKAPWINLAKTLQAKGYAVLRFDFRGCGDSTTVKPGGQTQPGKPAKPGFWDYNANKNYSKVSWIKRPPTIELKQFNPGYYPILLNDIAAAKAWLDTAPCNSNNLTLIGAKDGATLGAVWLNSEWHRFRYVFNPMFMKDLPDRENPEGQAVTAAVWFTISPKLGHKSVSLSSLLYKSAGESKIPMLFFYSKGDAAGKSTSVGLVKFFKSGKVPKGAKKSAISEFTGAVDLEAEKATGSALISQKVSSDVGDYLKQTEKFKDVRKTEGGPGDTYVWLVPTPRGPITQVARKAGKQVPYNYAPFVR